MLTALLHEKILRFRHLPLASEPPQSEETHRKDEFVSRNRCLQIRLGGAFCLYFALHNLQKQHVVLKYTKGIAGLVHKKADDVMGSCKWRNARLGRDYGRKNRKMKYCTKTGGELYAVLTIDTKRA